MKNLFYSSTDQMLFWIAGYTADNNTSYVMEINESLIKNSRLFRKHCKCKASQVRTIMIYESRKYKYMRAFFIEKPKHIPDDAYQLNNDWTMHKWITN